MAILADSGRFRPARLGVVDKGDESAQNGVKVVILGPPSSGPALMPDLRRFMEIWFSEVARTGPELVDKADPEDGDGGVPWEEYRARVVLPGVHSSLPCPTTPPCTTPGTPCTPLADVAAPVGTCCSRCLAKTALGSEAPGSLGRVVRKTEADQVCHSSAAGNARATTRELGAESDTIR